MHEPMRKALGWIAFVAGAVTITYGTYLVGANLVAVDGLDPVIVYAGLYGVVAYLAWLGFKLSEL